MRAVTLSNTILVTTLPDLQVQDEISQILELVPTLPKLQRLTALLQGCEYDEGHERDDEESDVEMDDDFERPVKRARVTREDAKKDVQASDIELARALKDQHILIIDGACLRLLYHRY